MNVSHRLLSSTLLASSLLVAAGCTGGHDGSDISEPSQVAEAISQGVASVATVTPTQVVLAEGLFSLQGSRSLGNVDAQSCSELENLLTQSCDLVEGLGGDSYCYAESTFFMAHSQPRCASRLHLAGGLLDRVYAFDLTGEALSGPVDTCGDGIVDEEEQCDDGNREDFDGCSQVCEIEEFQGCEAVIEQYYQDAEIAFVDKNLWDGPRSHLMINPTAKALRDVDQRTCDAALAVGVDVCNELSRQMPFVAGCQPLGGLRSVEGLSICDVRFQVYFDSVSPDDGVFTTAMSGILAFSIGG